MILLLQILLWFNIFLIFHSYILFPFILFVLSRHKQTNYNYGSSELPDVDIIMSLYNEESVISNKLDSIINSNYPIDKIKIIVGSDNSQDLTNSILESYSKQYDFIDFTIFTTRQGKSNVINQMIDKSRSTILILTDANVIFDKNTIRELVKPFSHSDIGLVDTQMCNYGLKKEGISIQEKSYISREVRIKTYESILWGTMMGPFGGCYAIRRDLYSVVPATFLVDDFYICMKILQKGYKTINNINAVVYEDVSNNLSDEFRRKIRIATGNFQNLREFKSMLISKIKGLSFCFISHKVLRWLTPIFMIIAYLSSLILSITSLFYLFIFILYTLLFFLPILDFLLKKRGYNNIFLRFITHFLSMNLALLIGMFKSIKGVKTNVWKPTKRHQ